MPHKHCLREVGDMTSPYLTTINLLVIGTRIYVHIIIYFINLFPEWTCKIVCSISHISITYSNRNINYNKYDTVIT